MAAPRVFISSTFYDLRQLREDVDAFIKELGYDPVRHEASGVPYGATKPLDQYAYKEVKNADILICLIGGRYGTSASDNDRESITQRELVHALRHGTQVFVFIEAKVAHEFETFKANKGNNTITYRYVDDTRIYEFIERLYSLPNNNTIAEFETSRDIVDYLRSQFAGMFQRFLGERRQDKQLEVLEKLEESIESVDKISKYMDSSLKTSRSHVESLVQSLEFNHPVVKRIRAVLELNYAVSFSNLEQLASWLEDIGYSRCAEPINEDFLQWDTEKESLVIPKDWFSEDGALKRFSAAPDSRIDKWAIGEEPPFAKWEQEDWEEEQWYANQGAD